MKKTRLWTSTIAAVALAVGALMSAVPAQAAATGTVTDNGDGTATVVWSGYANISQASVSMGCTGLGSPCYSYRPSTVSGTITVSEGLLVTSGLTQVPLPAGTYDIKLTENTTTVIAQSNGVQIGSGGGPSSDATESAPVEVSLTLDLEANGASCKDGSAAKGLVGTWLTLPSADDCSSTTRTGAKLLGWSTSANFPVQRAQSQIDNGWGTIDEVIDGVRMIFIPAGKATFVSGPNSLHPVWAS